MIGTKFLYLTTCTTGNSVVPNESISTFHPGYVLDSFLNTDLPHFIINMVIIIYIALYVASIAMLLVKLLKVYVLSYIRVCMISQYMIW